MKAKINEMGSDSVQIICFAKHKISEIDVDIGDLQVEKKLWQNILKRFNVCKACEGSGNTYTTTGKPPYHPTCKACDGTGEIK